MTKPLRRSAFALLLSASTTVLAVAEEQKPSRRRRRRVDARATQTALGVAARLAPARAEGREKGMGALGARRFRSCQDRSANGLTPSPDADRATFIRRATLDAWGVIPTPEEVAAFESDKSPDAYEKLVDRLLASPRYGERQARLWLDLARYADSTGFQNDNVRPNMFRYRDYVIKAFNEDKPYSQFIREQIAGDEIAPGNQDVLVATGFLAGYPDNHNSRDLVQRKYQITTDMTDTVGQAILGTTVGCARCHNHKSDKFTQKDYFSLQAFFANTAFDEKIPARKGEVEAAYEQGAGDLRRGDQGDPRPSKGDHQFGPRGGL